MAGDLRHVTVQLVKLLIGARSAGKRGGSGSAIVARTSAIRFISPRPRPRASRRFRPRGNESRSTEVQRLDGVDVGALGQRVARQARVDLAVFDLQEPRLGQRSL